MRRWILLLKKDCSSNNTGRGAVNVRCDFSCPPPVGIYAGCRYRYLSDCHFSKLREQQAVKWRKRAVGLINIMAPVIDSNDLVQY
jgi:hypothetical protein